MKFSRETWLVLVLTILLGCGDDGGEKPTVCQQLQSALCSRTRECAEAAGLTAQHSTFFANCLSSDLQCREPLVGGDFELCEASLTTLPCDYVVEQLHEEKLVSSSNCEEYIAL